MAWCGGEPMMPPVMTSRVRVACVVLVLAAAACTSGASGEGATHTGGTATNHSTVSSTSSSIGPRELKAKPERPCPRAVASPGPRGTILPKATIGETATATQQIVFGLADRAPLFGVVYPTISTDGGTTWRLDGPCFYYAAAQGPSATDSIGARAPDWAYAWGRGGVFVRVTHDGGAHWFEANLPDPARHVVASGRTLRAYLYGTRSTYVSRDYGLTWRLFPAPA